MEVPEPEAEEAPEEAPVSGEPEAVEEGEGQKSEGEAASAPSAEKAYAAQVGAFSSLENADSLVVKLKKKGYPAYARVSASREGKTLFLVLIGRYGDMNKALEIVAALKEFEKMDSFVAVLR